MKKEVIVGDLVLFFFLFGEGFVFLGGGKIVFFFVNLCILVGCLSMCFCVFLRFVFEYLKFVFLFIFKRVIGEMLFVGVVGCL